MENSMALKNLHDVLVDLVKDTYHAEKQLVKALPQLAKAASNNDLRAVFEDHLKETEGHVDRLEQVFAALNMKPVAKPCHGMMGLIEEGKEIIGEKSDSNPIAIDAALIAAAQKCEHYEIVAYGTMATFAEVLSLADVAELFKQTLEEEESADDKLNELAEGSINNDAAEADDEDEDETPVTKKKTTHAHSAGGGKRK